MSDDVEFSADVAAPSKLASPTALKEQSVIEAGSPAPNSVIIKLWKGGHLCFNPDNHTSIFSLIALMAILGALLIMGVIGIWTAPNAVWMEKISSALGYGITGIIGAMVGSAASVTGKKKED